MSWNIICALVSSGTLEHHHERGKCRCFLSLFAFVTNKCLVQDAFEKCPRTTEKPSKYTAVRE